VVGWEQVSTWSKEQLSKSGVLSSLSGWKGQRWRWCVGFLGGRLLSLGSQELACDLKLFLFIHLLLFPAGDLQQHLQAMFILLRPEDNIRLVSWLLLICC